MYFWGMAGSNREIWTFVNVYRPRVCGGDREAKFIESLLKAMKACQRTRARQWKAI